MNNSQHNTFHIVLSISVALSITLVSMHTSGQESVVRDEVRKAIPGLAQLRARTERTGNRVRVLARLSQAALKTSPNGSPDALTAVPMVTDNAQTKEARDRLVRRMLSVGATSAQALAGLPVIVLEANKQELDALIAKDEVAQLTEDILHTIELAESGPLVGAPYAWASGASGADTTIAVIDTGVQADHPFLIGRVLDGACFSSGSAALGLFPDCPVSTTAGPCSALGCGHGTHVAGIAAGHETASFGFSGIARDARILPIMAFSRLESKAKCDGKPNCPMILTSDSIRALQYVRERRKDLNIVAVNMSFGSADQERSSCDGTDMRTELVNDLLAHGVASVVASGNEFFTDAVNSPGCISSAITVGATTKSDDFPLFSNSSPLVDLVAPGEGISSSIPGGSRGEKSGTSMAAPHVAGAIAVLKSKVPDATPAQCLSALQTGGHLLTDPRNGLTFARLDLAAALMMLTGDSDGDDIRDEMDNCPNIPNHDQANLDGDRFGDVCDEDIDNDGCLNPNDDASRINAMKIGSVRMANCGNGVRSLFDSSAIDHDGDGLLSCEDDDDDDDGIQDNMDHCPTMPISLGEDRCDLVNAEPCEVIENACIRTACEEFLDIRQLVTDPADLSVRFRADGELVRDATPLSSETLRARPGPSIQRALLR